MLRTALSLTALLTLAAPVAADVASAEKEIRAGAQAFAAAWASDDAKAMASFFGERATLINPFGRLAAGRAEIERLFAEEHASFLAHTTYGITVARIDWATPEVAVVLWDVVCEGMKNADGTPAPPLVHQVTVVEHKVGDAWLADAARPVVYPPAPAVPR